MSSVKHKETLVGVVTSEKTWHHLDRYCFNDNFIENRPLFDLAVVFNGKDSEGIKYVNNFLPEYLFVRPNASLDPAAFDFLIKNIPVYERYILLHDDHWFIDKNWFHTINVLMNLHEEVDVRGNLVKSDINKPLNSLLISSILGCAEYQPENFPYFLQGLAGLFKGKVIEAILKLDGIPHIHNNNKEVAQVCERIFSFILLKEGFIFAQIPPGYEKYLKHRDY